MLDNSLLISYNQWVTLSNQTNNVKSNFPSDKMTQIKDNVDRSILQDRLVNSMIEGMDFKTMWSVLYDFMNESYDKYSDEELTEEVKEYYPELLDWTTIMNTLQVEQLQEDIITIMESHFPNEDVDEVIELLCNAVTYTFNDSNRDQINE